MHLKEKVYQLCRTIPKGKVTTYREIGRKLNTKAYRAVGQILKNNPYAPVVPCHRVVSSSGKIGGFKGKTSGKAIQEKIQMLKAEGVQVQNNSIRDFKAKFYEFS